MNCSTCGHANPERTKFCGECGSPIAARCASCDTPLSPGVKFCGECGGKVAGSAAAGPPAAVPDRSPRDYTPKHLADKILQSRSALEGERKQVTVLFADVKGSMELAQQLDPEHWHGILERFFEILAEGVHRFEGTVNQYTGDGIMALFGAPLTHEDHAQRACYAALALRDTLRDFAREVERQHGLDFATRIGINSGEVVVGKIGDDLRMDYTAQGQTVGLAQRMEALASGGSIYLSEHTRKLVHVYFALDDLGDFTLKGATNSVRVYELTGIGSARTRFDLSRARGLSKFAGRSQEMNALESALGQALAGHGQVFGVVANAGTGKSRLCFEFAEACRAKGISVRATTGVAHGKAVPLLPVLEFYRGVFGITTDDDARAARQKIGGTVLAIDESLVPSLPLLFDFLGVPDPEKPVVLEPGPERQRALLAVLKRMTLERSRRQPAVILFEDLHWVYEAKEVFLENLVDATDSSRTLLLVNFRPEYRAEWMRRYQQLALAPLDPSAFAEMLGETLGADPSLRGLVDRIHARSGGNPFFAGEIVLSLIESGVLGDALRTLVQAEFLHETALYPEPEYAFKHPLTQEVALGSQLRERRARVHALVATALLEIHAGALDEQSALLAHHFESAGDATEAVRWHERAATWLEGRDPKAGLHHWERLVELVGAEPESADPARVALGACARIIDLGMMFGLDFARGEELYRRDRAMAARFEEPDLEAALIAFFARFAAMGGESLLGFEMVEEALRVAPRSSDAGRYADLIVAASTTLALAGRLSDAIATLESVLASGKVTASTPTALARLLSAHATWLIHVGHRADARASVDRAAELLTGQRAVLGVLVNELARMQELAARGLPEGLLERIALHVARTDESGVHFFRVGFRARLAEVHLFRGDPDAALDAAEAGIGIALETRAALYRVPQLELLRVRALLALGDLAQARDAIEHLVAVPQRNLLNRGPLLVAHAEVLIAADAVGQRSRIESSLGEAADLAQRMGTLPLQAAVCTTRAQLARALIAPDSCTSRFRSRRACRFPDSRRRSARELRERVQS